MGQKTPDQESLFCRLAALPRIALPAGHTTLGPAPQGGLEPHVMILQGEAREVLFDTRKQLKGDMTGPRRVSRHRSGIRVAVAGGRGLCRTTTETAGGPSHSRYTQQWGKPHKGVTQSYD